MTCDGCIGSADPLYLRSALLRTMDRYRLTQEDVALLVGVDRAAVSRYIKGSYQIPLALAVSLARIGHPELLEEACAKSGGTYREGMDHVPDREPEIVEHYGTAHRYCEALADADRDGVRTPSELQTMLSRAEDARRHWEAEERRLRAALERG